MRTRSKARAELAAQAQFDDSNSSNHDLDVQLAEDPLPKVLEMGFTTKKRRRKKDAQENSTRNQPVANRILADAPKIQRRRTGRVSSSHNGARVKEVDLELKVLGKRKRKMRGSLQEKKPVKRCRADDGITPSIEASDGFSQGEVSQSIGGSLTIGMPLERAEEQPHSRPMTAKMRWKDRARSVINENKADPLASIVVLTPDEEQHVSQLSYRVSPIRDENPPCQTLELATLLKEQCHQIGHGGNVQQIQKRKKLKITRQQSVKAKRQQRARKKRIGILKKLKLWATQTKFLQNTLEPNGNSTGATELRLVMTENDRENFVQKMVKQCRNNRDLRSSFLESVKTLVNSGLMHSAASTLLNKGPCEEAQVVVKAWENFQMQQSTGKGLPMDLLNAVAELHEKRKDLSGELARFEESESCSLRQIHDSTWQIKISNHVPMERSSIS